jgi:hypothetical protein
MPKLQLKEVDKALLGAFEALRNSSPGDMLDNLARDTLAAKGFPRNVTLPTANETAALQRISDILDQCVAKNDMNELYNNVTSTDVGILYLKAAVTGARRQIILPTLTELKGRGVAAPPPTTTTNVIEQNGQIVYERLPDANGTVKIVETDTVSKQTRLVAGQLTSDQYKFLMAMTNEKASNVLVYEQWEDAAASPASPNAPGPSGPTLPDNLPAAGDFTGLDPMIQELMRAQQERLGNI